MEGMGPSLAVQGASTAAIFETYVERVLSPMLRPGQVVVRGNLTAHKGEKVRQLIEERGCELMYLPPYSPDFNPIEEAFANIKCLLPKFEGRRREALIDAIAQASSAVSVRDARGSFEHCGYHAMIQPF